MGKTHQHISYMLLKIFMHSNMYSISPFEKKMILEMPQKRIIEAKKVTQIDLVALGHGRTCQKYFPGDLLIKFLKKF